MATKDISDFEVLSAYEESDKRRLFQDDGTWPDDLLLKRTGQHPKVVNASMERAYSRGYVECGLSLRCGWLTEKGIEFLKNQKLEKEKS